MSTKTSKATKVVGVDLGGTKIMAGIYGPGMECHGYAKIRTKSHKGPDEVLTRIVRCINEAVENAEAQMIEIKAIGIGAPGPIDTEEGRVIFAPNLGWKDYALKQKLQALLQVPVFLENDCTICTLGVHAVELNRKPRHMIGIFIGTGIGGGLILDGKLYRGFKHAAGEIGHMVLDLNGPQCGCGNRGCFEALASRTAIFRRILEEIKKGRTTALTELAGQDLEDLRSGSLRKAMARGDALVKEVIEEAARYMGVAAANVANLLNPEFIVFGGGVIEQLEDYMIHVIIDTARTYAMPGTLNGVSIQASKLADDAGIVGAGVLAFELSK